jgi:hypothetical protein
MKHEKINRQLLNLDKTWRHLSLKQRDWICCQLRSEYVDFLNINKHHPNKEQCREIVGDVYDRIKERGIWIPFNEVKKAFSSKLSRYRKIKLS